MYQVAHLLRSTAEWLSFKRQDAGTNCRLAKSFCDRSGNLVDDLLRRAGRSRDAHPRVGIDAGQISAMVATFG